MPEDPLVNMAVQKSWWLTYSSFFNECVWSGSRSLKGSPSPGTFTQIQCQSLVASICLPCQTLKAFHILTVTLYLYHVFNLTVTRAKKLAWDSLKKLYFLPRIQQPIVLGLIANCYSTKQENWLSTCYEWKKIQQYLAKEILKCIVAVRCI